MIYRRCCHSDHPCRRGLLNKVPPFFVGIGAGSGWLSGADNPDSSWSGGWARLAGRLSREAPGGAARPVRSQRGSGEEAVGMQPGASERSQQIIIMIFTGSGRGEPKASEGLLA